MFEPGDGSVNQRLHALHTRAEHADEALLREEFVGGTPLCVWLTNEGLKSADAWLTYEEAADELVALARWARRVEDPLTIPEKLKAMQGSPSAETIGVSHMPMTGLHQAATSRLEVRRFTHSWTEAQFNTN